MIVPNKVISYNESLLPKLPQLVQLIQKNEKIGVPELFYIVHKEFDDISQFAMALETLYALNKIDFVNGEIKYVG